MERTTSQEEPSCKQNPPSPAAGNQEVGETRATLGLHKISQHSNCSHKSVWPACLLFTLIIQTSAFFSLGGTKNGISKGERGLRGAQQPHLSLVPSHFYFIIIYINSREVKFQPGKCHLSQKRLFVASMVQWIRKLFSHQVSEVGQDRHQTSTLGHIQLLSLFYF